MRNIARNNVISLFGASPVVPVSKTPIAGYYYLPKKGDVPSRIAKKAYQDSGLTTTRKGLFLINDNPANGHIKKGKSGWESFGVKGLQLNPDYDSTDAQAAHGSGNGYPLVWIPPLNGATPDQVMGGGAGTPGKQGKAGAAGTTGPQGIPGARGPAGPQGMPGAAGRTPTSGELKSLISDFMDENPVAGQVSSQELATAVSNHLKNNPVAQGPRGNTGPQGPQGEAGHTPTSDELKSLISDFMDENPVAGQVSSQELATAVSNHLKNNPVAQGPRGNTGPQGPQGPRGQGASSEQVQSAVSTYLQENPVESGGSGFDMDQARDFVDARIRVAMRNIPTTSAGGDFDLANMTWNHAALFMVGGILGAAMLEGLQKTRRRSGNRRTLASNTKALV